MISRTLTILGSLLILVGIFMPMISGPPELQTKSFFTWGEYWDGLLVFVLALAGIVIGITDKCRWGIAIAGVTLLLTYLAWADFHKLQEVSGALQEQSMDNVSLAMGPWVLAFGSLMMITAASIAIATTTGKAVKSAG